MPSTAVGDHPEGIFEPLVPDPCCVKPDGLEGKLHDGAGGEGADQGSNPDRSSEKPTDQGRCAEKSDADRADGHFLQPPGEPHQQRIPRPAAQGSHHIGILGIGQDNKTNQHH